MTQSKPKQTPLIWGNLLHLSYNMWEDHISQERPERGYRDTLRFDEDLWKDLTNEMSRMGMNMVVLDLGDGIKYKRHRDIHVQGAWGRKKLKSELNRLRDLGLEPIPKLNFSTCHDAWLGKYERMVGTPRYYRVVQDLIEETIEKFDGPRFFHLGMDEETYQHQRFHHFIALRQGPLWWHDLNFYIKTVTDNGARPWIWSDAIWRRKDDFLKNMDKSVVQSNWYYGKSFSKKVPHVAAYQDLNKADYDQIPTGSNWTTPNNFPSTVRFCAKNLDSKKLLGFLQTPWHPTIKKYRHAHFEALEAVKIGLKIWKSQRRPSPCT